MVVMETSRDTMCLLSVSCPVTANNFKSAPLTGLSL